ncbi:MAG TPA: ankyrin repeat domain-containing protein, partial [Candidatus Aminicenantes bacterium]|nr:ankyrin repeat domain-containing protein [Candidatus Aminicenantes bacterium]
MTPSDEELHGACRNGDLSLVQKALKPSLFKKKADIDSRNPYGESPLTIALASGFPEIAEWLMREGADLST